MTVSIAHMGKSKWVLQELCGTTKHYQFGYEVPKNVRHAYELDQLQGNTKWADAMRSELKSLDELKVFRPLRRGQPPPANFKLIPLLWVFTIKPDGTHKARCVTGGHVTGPMEDNVFAAVVKMPNIQLVLLLVALNDLQVLMGDIKNAYLYAKMHEKVFIIAGEEFDPLQGLILVVKGAWYGLKSSGNHFFAHLSDNIRKQSFVPSKPDKCVWFREMHGWNDYLLTHVDNINVAARDAVEVIKDLQRTYVIKKIDPPM